MSNGSSASNKAKIARRVIEVLEYFDDLHTEATVMDIVRRYDRPQSSTSELLSSLVELGLLHKDPYARSYRLTARAALLGSSGQPQMIRDGRLVRLMDQLVSQTGLSIALFGMVGLDSQIVTWRPGQRNAGSRETQLYGGIKAPLSSSSAGWLMLSTVDSGRREGMVRRLNAEADPSQKFAHADMMAQIEACGERKYVFGPVGHGTHAQNFVTLVPRQPEGHPLAISVIYGRDDKVNAESLMQCVDDAMRKCLPDPEVSNVEKFPNAA